MKNKSRELRARNRMTQEALAAKAGVSRQTILAIENEKYDPSLSLAFKISKIFHARLDEIFFG
ncbi:helix-turn-helix transcriptional regulator [Candidatus Micrarchaeota archaeon]|nr:helix-turn-helix transcriptional regulator [Candidatus Micrarchaeota archaeon]